MIVVLAVALASFGAVAQDSRVTSLGVVENIETAAGARAYVMYAPAELDADAVAPLWVGLHGRLSSARAFEVESQLNALADQFGARVVYPQAQFMSWNNGGAAAGLPSLEEDNANPDDIAMINAIVDARLAEGTVSETWFMGFDTGGLMGLRMLCERPDAAGAVVVGAMPWNYLTRTCEASSSAAPQRVLFIHGNGDDIYPAGGEDSEYSMEDGTLLRRLDRGEAMAFFANRAGCVQTELKREGSVLRAVGCDSVLLIGVSGGGHEWFGSPVETAPVSGVDSNGLIASWLNGEEIELDNQPVTRLPRTHVLYLPMSYDGDALPLVVALHGRPDTGAGFASITDLGVLAESEGFAAVFPDGIQNQWNYLGAFVEGGEFSIPNDIIYLEALPETIAQAVNIDLSRVILTGFSNGGFMTYRIACEISHPYSGFAIVGAQMYPDFELQCNASRPVPILIIHGTADISIDFNGIVHSTFDQGQVFTTRSATQSAAYWVGHNRCDIDTAEREERDLNPETGTQVLIFDFPDCAKDAAVRFVVIAEGGHAWPGVNRVPAEVAGNVAMDYAASRDLWDFLGSYTRDDF
jgi:polyhydroxybutyrate depolymerase